MHFPEIADTQPELLAHHFAQAGQQNEPSNSGVLPAYAASRSANAEAAAHFSGALDLLATLPKREHNEQALDLTLNLAVPLIATYGFGSLRVEECALKAIALSETVRGSPNQFAAHRVAWNSRLMRQPLPRTIASARDLTRLAEEDHNPARIAVADRSLGYSLLIIGEFREAAEIFAHGASTADTVDDREFAVYGEHPNIICRIYGGQAKMSLGFRTRGCSFSTLR